ncbi:MAG: hypothetical protein ABIT58_02155 [Ferruginibacter sp.]
MKTAKLIFSMLLCLTMAASFAQKSEQAKQKFFTAYPESIQLSKNILQNTMNASEGEMVVVGFSNDFNFKGTVISNLKNITTFSVL